MPATHKSAGSRSQKPTKDQLKAFVKDLLNKVKDLAQPISTFDLHDVLRAHFGTGAKVRNFRKYFKPVRGKNRKNARFYRALAPLTKLVSSEVTGTEETEKKGRGKKRKTRSSRAPRLQTVLEKKASATVKMAKAQALFIERDNIQKRLTEVNSELQRIFS